MPIAVAIASALFVYWLLGIYGNSEIRRQKRENQELLHRELDQNRSAIEQIIAGQKNVARSLAGYVEFNPLINQVIFSKWAQQIFIKSNTHSLTFQITQNDFLDFNYPKNSANTIHLKLKIPSFKDVNVKLDSVNKVVTFFDATLLNGKPAIIYQNFIYTKDSTTNTYKYWGNAVIVDDLTELVQQVPFESNNRRKFNVSIENKSGKTLIQVGDTIEEDILAVTEFFNLQMVKVKLRLGKKELFTSLLNKANRLQTLFIVISILIAFLNAFIIANMFSIKRSNKILAFKNTQIRAQLSEKVLLIKELHHRIKNHFQLISSLNRTLSTKLQNSSTEDVIEDINGRIELMAKAYDKIGGSNYLKNFMPEYIPSIVNSLIVGAQPKISVIYNISPSEINIKRTVYLGILLNELVVNSLKHGFKLGNKSRNITINFTEVNSSFILTYLTNGEALPTNIFDLHKSSTGVQILSLFTEQLEGNIKQIKLDTDSGYEIQFPKK